MHSELKVAQINLNPYRIPIWFFQGNTWLKYAGLWVSRGLTSVSICYMLSWVWEKQDECRNNTLVLSQISWITCKITKISAGITRESRQRNLILDHWDSYIIRDGYLRNFIVLCRNFATLRGLQRSRALRMSSDDPPEEDESPEP